MIGARTSRARAHPIAALLDHRASGLQSAGPVPACWPATRCCITDPAGALLAEAIVDAGLTDRGAPSLIVRVADAGRLVHWYIVKSRYDVHVRVGSGAPIPARIDGMRFVPDVGRICRLRVIE